MSDLGPFAQLSYQPLFHMFSRLAQYLAAIAKMKIPHPTAHSGVHFIDAPLKRHDRPLSFREIRDPVFD